MKVCFFGAYNPDYARNAAVMQGMLSAGIEVEEINEKGTPFIIRAPKLFFKVLKKDFDVLWVCFPGHLDVLPAKLACILKRKP